MTDRNDALVREAYEAYGRGDVAVTLEFVDPELEWELPRSWLRGS